MKKLILMTLVLLVAFVAAPAFAEDGVTGGATWYTPHEGFTEWLNDNDINHEHRYNKEGKGLDELKAKVGGKVTLVKITTNLQVDVEAKKDVYKTNFEEGWEGEALLVYTKPLFDFSE